jgi:hypothetical integral membrane protein (TIGR02206 family)
MAPLETAHVVVVGATAVVAALAIWVAPKLSDGWVSAASRGLAVAIIVAYGTYHAAAAVRGDWSPDRYLPFHLTDTVTIVCVIALWAPRPLAVELAYFWGLTASLQAVLTPDVPKGFPDLYFWTYFLTHSGAVVAACLLVFGRRLWPRPGAVWRVYAATAAVAGLAAIANLATGGNYMFLREKPASVSLLDLMGPWPVYILVGCILALAMFVALDAPFRGDRRSRREGVAAQ